MIKMITIIVMMVTIIHCNWIPLFITYPLTQKYKGQLYSARVTKEHTHTKAKTLLLLLNK